MKNRLHIIIIILTLGFFLSPTLTYACGTKTKKSCCKIEISSTKSEKKSCCNSDSSKEKDHKGCKGNCGHSKCGCSSTCPTSSVNFLSEIIFKNYMFGYSSIEKATFSYTTPSISDGFYSIWLIPKIS